MSQNAPRMAGAAMIVTAITLLLTGCAHGTTPAAGGVGAGTSVPASSGNAATAFFSGVWSGTWTRVTSPRGSGTYRWVLHQRGQQITGTLEAGSSACLTKGPLTGHVSGPHIILHAVTPAVNGVGQASATYHGTLAGGTLSGTAVVKCSVGVGYGTWKLTR